MLVIPHRKTSRLTDLTSDETADIFKTVQKVQRMLAHVYFDPSSKPVQAAITNDLSSLPLGGKPENGSFNVALQDGPDAGQSVSHVHVHIIPRLKENGVGDEIYDRLAGPEGNVGGHQYDKERPINGGKFPKIEDEDRKPRTTEQMNQEAAFYRKMMERLG